MSSMNISEAILSDNFEELLAILDADPDRVDQKIKQAGDAPPLALACLHNRLKMVNELIERKADLLGQDADGRCALHCACERGHIECASAVLVALSPRKWIRPMLRSRDKAGWSPLLLAARSGILAAVMPLFAEGEPDLDEPHEDSGRTALMCCASRGDTEGARALAKGGCNLNFRNPRSSMTALMYAAMEGHIEVARELVESNGCDVDLQGSDRDETAAHLACSMGHVELGQLLLEHGSCALLKDIDGNVPGDLVIEESTDEGMKESTDEVVAVREGQIETVEASGRVCLFIDFNYEDLEVMYPKIRLAEDNLVVTVVGAHPAGTKYTGKFGYPCKSDLCVDDVSADQFDGLVIPGGFAPDYMRRNQKMLDLITAMLRQNKPVAAWAGGLARWPESGKPVVAGVRCTSFVAVKDDVVNAGGIWVDEPVVVDQNIITSRTPEDLTPWCKAISSAVIAIASKI